MRTLGAPRTRWPEPQGSSSLTIGVLDGVHFGHRELLGRLDQGLVSTVLTFDPHPIETLKPGSDPRLITDIEERATLLEACGIDQMVVLDLAEIKELSPEEFVADVLVDRLDVGHLVVGVDFRFGQNRGGDAGLLRLLGRRYGFEVETIDLVERGVATISSSRIRTEIEAGRLDAVAGLMPARFQLTNNVVEGDERGRAIGFPTANMRPPERKVLPAMGVYAAFAHVQDDVHQAAVNVGTRPTFGGGELFVEAFLIDFDDDLYGKPLTVEFVEYLRPELGFDSVDGLVAQMAKDVKETAGVLTAVAPSVS